MARRIIEQVIFEQRSEWIEGGSHSDTRRMAVLSRGKDKCRGSEAGTLEHLRSSEVAALWEVSMMKSEKYQEPGLQSPWSSKVCILHDTTAHPAILDISY